MSKNKFNVFNYSKTNKEFFSKFISYLKNKENIFIHEILSYIDDINE